MKNIVDWMNGWNLDGKLSLLWFVPITLLLVWASINIVKYAEVIMTKTKFGTAFIGGILIATITSMPELMTGISQSVSGTPGAGNADNIGSNSFSAFLIGIAGIIFVRESFLKRLGKWTIISLWISFALALVTTLMMYFQTDLTIGKEGKFAIGLFPIGLFAFYLFSLYLQYKNGDEDEADHENEFIKKTSVKKSTWLFVLWSAIVILLSLVLNWNVSSIKHGYNIDERSAGGIFLSMATSLPEIIAFFALLKKKQTSAAIAALIGSHIFNLSIDFFGDISYPDQAIYNMKSIHENWPLALMTALMMLVLAIFTMASKKYKIFNNKNVYLIGPILVTLIYVVGWVLMIALK